MKYVEKRKCHYTTIQVNIKLSNLRPCPHESGYAETAFLQLKQRRRRRLRKRHLFHHVQFVKPHEYAMRFTFPHC